MKILMIESVGTKDGAYNEEEVYDVDKDTAKEWVELGYAVRVGGRESTAKSPAKRKSTRKKVSKR